MNIWNKFLNLLRNFTFYFLYTLKYFSILIGFIFIIIQYESPLFLIKNLNNQTNINIKNCYINNKSYTQLNGNLLKHYSYYYWNKKIYINSEFQNIKFLINNIYYDVNGIKIYNNHISSIGLNEIKYEKIIYINNAPYMDDVVFLYKIFNKFIYNIFSEVNNKVYFNFINFRWNMIILYNNYELIIKLPEVIDKITLKHIHYINNNIYKFLPKNKNSILDLRFGTIIVI